MGESSKNEAEVNEMVSLLRQWEEEHQSANYDPTPVLIRMAELIEVEIENYMKMDPDPFDERHPSRSHPDCCLGHMLKVLFKKDIFMNKLVSDYLRENFWRAGEHDVRELNTAAARLMLDMMPGLETSVVFQETNGLIDRLYVWAEKSLEPMRTYATGLLAAAMDVQDIASNYRDKNGHLVPLMLERLRNFQQQMLATTRPFAHLGDYAPDPPGGAGSGGGGREEGGGTDDEGGRKRNKRKREASPEECALNCDGSPDTPGSRSMAKKKADGGSGAKSHITFVSEEANLESPLVRTSFSPRMPPTPAHPCYMMGSPPGLTSPKNPPTINECSNSSWVEMESNVIGSFKMYPPTLSTKQMLILRYLTPMGEYQDLLGHVFEHNALDLILRYINLNEFRDSRLAFEALKYLAALLCHKKFSLEFINMDGLQRLLDVPRPSIAATGVSLDLYYLAYCEDAMERVCLLPKSVLAHLVRYALWLLECSHDSGRCHATMFFGFSFQFRVILDLFDEQDGLRKLFNVVSTLPILTADDHNMNDDEEFVARQAVRHMCSTLKRYLEAHLTIKAESLRRSHIRDQGGAPSPLSTPYKAARNSPEKVREDIATLLELLPFYSQWTPVRDLVRLGGVQTLLQVVAMAYEWNYSGRAETVRSALDALAVCSCVPEVQLIFCESVKLLDDTPTVGVTILLGAAEGEIVADPDVQRSALNVIINCVCAPTSRVGGNFLKYGLSASSPPSGSQGSPQVGGRGAGGGGGGGGGTSTGNWGISKRRPRNIEDLLERLWDSIQSNNGIMVLLQLMMVKTPITDADSIRALACKALAGLARSSKVCQIVGKLSLFANGQLQILMREPILQDKRQDHVTFQRHALDLLERVSGKSKPSVNEYDVSLAKIHRASVVAQTRIQYNEKQLIQLIHGHLVAKGLAESASALQREAGIPFPPIRQGAGSNFPPPPYRGALSSPTPNRGIRLGNAVTHSALRPLLATSPVSTPVRSIMPSSTASPTLSTGTTSIPSSPAQSSTVTAQPSTSNAIPPLTSALSTPTTSGTQAPISFRVHLTSRRTQPTTTPALISAASTPASSGVRSLQKQLSQDPSLLQVSTSTVVASTALAPVSPLLKGDRPPTDPTVTLDTIVTEYLMNQHTLCRNPMVTCPQFDLFAPHKCPDPKSKGAAACNVAVRLTRREVRPPHGGPDGLKLSRRLLYSRFRPVRSFRQSAEDSFLTCCSFSACEQFMMAGTYQGEVKLYNLQTAAEEATYQCHESYVYHVQPNNSGDLLLTSSLWRRPLSALWKMGNFFDLQFALENEEYVEFSKMCQDRIVGTKGEVATIYDVATGKKLLTLTPSGSNQYSKNRATYHPTDELVLCDGVLWDVTSGKEIHKFDKLNQTLSGVFHPSGMELVSNAEVWDLRTYHLLKTVPQLNQCQVVFSRTGHVLYAVALEQETEVETTYESSFKTLDASDYSSIATIDVKRNIYGLCCNKWDTQVALVENQGVADTVDESSVRLYDVGRLRDDEDEMEDEEDEDEEEEEEDDEGSDGSDNDDDENALDMFMDAADGFGGLGDSDDNNSDNQSQNEGDEGGGGDDDSAPEVVANEGDELIGEEEEEEEEEDGDNDAVDDSDSVVDLLNGSSGSDDSDEDNIRFSLSNSSW